MPKIYRLFFKSLAIAVFAHSTLLAAAPLDKTPNKNSFESLIADFEKSEIELEKVLKKENLL